MHENLTLAAVDRDGAIEETLSKIDGESSRGGFLRRAGLMAGGIAGGGALLGAFAGKADAATEQDIAIANFALTLEYLEAAFYTEAVQMGALSGRVLSFAKVVGAHERAHVAALRSLLGSRAVAKPAFNFRGTTESEAKFKATSQVLEDTGVMAYAGQAPRIEENGVLAAALSIHTVEARHASWIRHINGARPAPAAFDKPKTMAQILAAVKGTRFLAGSGPSMTSSGSSPAFTG